MLVSLFNVIVLEACLCVIDRAQQSKEMMRRRIAHQYQVIGGVLVVAGCI